MDNDTIEERIAEAAAFVHAKGKNPYRKGSGNIPYIVHPEAVVKLLKEWGYTAAENPRSIYVGWAHDMLEEASDPEETASKIIEACAEYAQAVLSGVRELSWDEIEDKDEYLKRIGQKAAPELLVVKIADRLCNTLDFIAAGNSWGRKYFRKGEKYLFGRANGLEHSEAICAKIAEVKALLKTI